MIEACCVRVVSNDQQLASSDICYHLAAARRGNDVFLTGWADDSGLFKQPEDFRSDGESWGLPV